MVCRLEFEFAQRAKLYSLLTGALQQRIKRTKLADTFHFGMDGINRRALVSLNFFQNVVVETFGAERGSDDLVPCR